MGSLEYWKVHGLCSKTDSNRSNTLNQCENIFQMNNAEINGK